MLFLADLAGDLALDAADDALAAFNIGADDAEAVEGNDGLLRLLRLLGAERGCAVSVGWGCRGAGAGESSILM